jgi:hypothetical protein
LESKIEGDEQIRFFRSDFLVVFLGVGKIDWKNAQAIDFIGGASGIRTLDPWIKSPLLYQLS